MYSESFNELYQFNLENRRWFPVTMRLPHKQQHVCADQAQEQQPSEDAGSSSAAPDRTAELPPGVSPEMAELIR